MKRSIKQIAILGLIAFFVLCSTLFVACNKQKEEARRRQEAERRAAAVLSVKTSFLSELGDGWIVDMSDASLVSREDAADYIIASEWLDMLCKVLDKSSLQTAKLDAFATSLKSDSAKSLFDDFTKNAQLIIPLMKQVGFTSTDVSLLLNGILRALINDSTSVMQNMIDRFNALLKQPSLSISAADNIDKNKSRINAARTNLLLSDVEKQNILESLSQSENALNSLVSFAYNMSVNLITDNIFDSLFSPTGGLGNITESEMSTVINSLMLNVSDLAQALNDSERAKLTAALQTVIDKFGASLDSFPLFGQIVSYAKYAYQIVDLIPIACDAALAAGNGMDAEFISSLKEYAENVDNYDNTVGPINSVIMLAKVLNSVMQGEDGFDKAKLNGVLDSFLQNTEGSGYDYQKAVPVVSVSFAIITADTLGSGVYRHASMNEDVFGQLQDFIRFASKFDAFKLAYYNWSSDATSANRAALIKARNDCRFEQYDIVFDGEPSAEWYKYYIDNGTSTLNRMAAQSTVAAVADLKQYVADFYDADSQFTDKRDLVVIASLPLLSIDAEEWSTDYESIMQSTVGRLLNIVAGLK